MYYSTTVETITPPKTLKSGTNLLPAMKSEINNLTDFLTFTGMYFAGTFGGLLLIFGSMPLWFMYMRSDLFETMRDGMAHLFSVLF